MEKLLITFKLYHYIEHPSLTGGKSKIMVIINDGNKNSKEIKFSKFLYLSNLKILPKKLSTVATTTRFCQYILFEDSSENIPFCYTSDRECKNIIHLTIGYSYDELFYISDYILNTFKKVR